MRSIIVGGGKVGYNLFKTLKEKDYDVVVVERNKDTCSKIAEDFDADVFCGDGTDLDILKDAGIDEAEIIAAVTGTDEENLVICQIAKKSFNINKTIARVNNPKNIKMFKTLGIDKIICSTEVIADLIQYELDKSDYRIISTFERGSMILAEIFIEEDCFWCGRFVKDLVLPEECVIVSVIRGESVVYPRGNTQILSCDKILVITNNSVLPEIIKEMRNGGNKNANK
jgi:trk system potassium uptake protein TrkA